VSVCGVRWTEVLKDYQGDFVACRVCVDQVPDPGMAFGHRFDWKPPFSWPARSAGVIGKRL
jgi:hypothetical protein